jgi:hypothetical protein
MAMRDLNKERRMSLPPVLEEFELAEHLNVGPGVMRRLRHSGQGPNYILAGRKILYLAAAVQDWLEGGSAIVEEK